MISRFKFSLMNIINIIPKNYLGIGANSGFTELVAEEVTKNAQEVLYQRYYLNTCLC